MPALNGRVYGCKVFSQEMKNETKILTVSYALIIFSVHKCDEYQRSMAVNKSHSQSKHLSITDLSRFFDCLAHPNIKCNFRKLLKKEDYKASICGKFKSLFF